PPLRQNRRAKVYYATQVSTNPPTIVLFTNSPDLFDNTYHRYLMKEIRDQLGVFTDIPIKLHLRKKVRDDAETEWEGEVEQKPAAKKPKKKRKSGLSFKTQLNDEDRERDRQSELWTDL